MNQKYFAIALLCVSIALLAQGKSKDDLSGSKSNQVKNSKTEITNLHDFMEDYTKEAMKYFKKTGDNSYLSQIVKEIPSLAIDEEREDWQKIVDEALAENKPENSCKSCHDLYKKPYKKSYRKREISVPTNLVGLDKEIRKKRK
jgi:hypothetical protein